MYNTYINIIKYQKSSNLAIFVSKLSDGGVQPVLSQCSVRPELVSSGIPLTSLRQSQPSMRFECVVVVVAASPRYLNFPPIFVFYERDSGAMLSCPPTNQSPESSQVRQD